MARLTDEADLYEIAPDGLTAMRTAIKNDFRTPVPVVLPAAASDSFGRYRVSEPFTLFDSKQIFDNQPLFWDDQQTSGSGTSSTHSANLARSRLTVTAATAGTRIRQTFQRFNYQPGKSQLILMTGVLNADGGGTGIQQCIGQYDDNNGYIWLNNEGVLTLRIRSNATGSPVDTDVTQGNFSIDNLDGTGPSGMTIDLSKTNIYGITYEWLGVGTATFFLVYNGVIWPVHQFHHANIESTVYMSTPNLPIRYEIIADGNNAGNASLDHICCSVISEGALEANGSLRCFSTGATHVDANTADLIYACVGIRLKSAYIGATIEIESASMISETNDDFELLLILNPTVAGTFTYLDQANSALQVAKGATANTVTGGTQLVGSFNKSSASDTIPLKNAIRLGSSIAGTVDSIVLCVRPLALNADIQACLNVRELI